MMTISIKERIQIIREYRKKINSPLMYMGRWQDFLEGDDWIPKNPKTKEHGQCLVCGQDISGRYSGSHFQQTHDFREAHQAVVIHYDNVLKNVFKGILKAHGLRLKEDAENTFHGVWWDARLYVNTALYHWNDETLEPIQDKGESNIENNETQTGLGDTGT